MRFIKNQLYPTWQKMSKYLSIEFVPYGKANQSQEATGAWKFQCQHGPDECKGNKLQACFLKHVTNSSQQVELVRCVMTASDPQQSGEQCARKVGLNYNETRACYEGAEGDNLLAALGDQTHSVSPAITFIPTVIFQKKYTQKDQDQSMSHFKTVLCNHITGDKPAICPSSSSATSPIGVSSLLFIVLTSLMYR